MIPLTMSHRFPRLQSALRSRLKVFAQDRLQILVLLCSGPTCRRFAVAHRWLRKDGAFLDDAWFCGPGCFEAAALAALSQGSRGERYTMPRLPRMPFRLLLLKNGILTESELQRAQAHVEQTGMPLAQSLVALGCATEAQVAAAQAAESGCAFYALPPEALAPELRLPPLLADRYGAAIVHGATDRIVVGFVHRVDRGLLAMIERLSGRRAEGCFITSAHREAQLALPSLQTGRHTSQAQSAPAARPVSRQQAARTILDQALRTGAEHVRVARSGELVWARLWKSEDVCEDCVLEVADESEGAAKASSKRSQRSGEKKLLAL